MKKNTVTDTFAAFVGAQLESITDDEAQSEAIFEITNLLREHVRKFLRNKN